MAESTDVQSGPTPNSLPPEKKPPTRRPPTLFSLGALGLALVAAGLGVLALTPYAGALKFPRPTLEGSRATLVYGGTFILPIVLGILAALMGGRAVLVADRANGRIGGPGPGVFAILIGLAAAVLGGVTTFVALIYPRL
jgi:hypothetical protein